MCVVCENSGHDPSTDAIITGQVQSGPPEWHQRELTRIADGTYKPIPDLPEFAAVTFRYEHFLHISKSAGALDMIAYTASNDKGKADRQTPMKFGRYLKQYYTGLTDEQIKTMVDALKIHLTDGGLAELRFATDRKTINRIFETPMTAKDGSDLSCMYGKFTHWINRPYHVYADSPDVAVAYIQDDDGNPVARSVVSTKDKGWVRLYGAVADRYSEDSLKNKNEYCRKLAKLLSMAGYEPKSLAGNRLTCLDKQDGQDVLPYIDGDDKYVRERDGYWLVVAGSLNGDIECDRTDGLYGEEEDEDYCGACDCSPCECIYCECCERAYSRGCDVCRRCEQCGNCITHDQCACDRCSDCNELVNPRSRYADRCQCDRCPFCRNLVNDCECPEDEDEDDDEDGENSNDIASDTKPIIRLAPMFRHDNPPTFVRLANKEGLLMPVVASFKYAGHIFLVHQTALEDKFSYFGDRRELSATYGPLGMRAGTGNTVEEVIADMSRYSDNCIRRAIADQVASYNDTYRLLLGPEEGIEL